MGRLLGEDVLEREPPHPVDQCRCPKCFAISGRSCLRERLTNAHQTKWEVIRSSSSAAGVTTRGQSVDMPGNAILALRLRSDFGALSSSAHEPRRARSLQGHRQSTSHARESFRNVPDHGAREMTLPNPPISEGASGAPGQRPRSGSTHMVTWFVEEWAMTMRLPRIGCSGCSRE
jgi:hypothetical protein